MELGRIDFIKKVLEKEVEKLECENESFGSVNKWDEDQKNLWFSLVYTIEFILPQFNHFEDLIHDGFNLWMNRRAAAEEMIENEMNFPCL